MTDRRLSAKAGAFPPSRTLELKRVAAERSARGLPVFDFGLGETKGDLAPRIAEAGAKAFRDANTMYGDPAGLTELRAAALRWLALEGSHGVEQVVITVGAKQSLLNVFLAVCDPGDTVLVESAPWVSYLPLAITASTNPVAVQPAAGERNRLKVAPGDLERALREHPRARLFLLNSPVNPTSQLYSAEEVEALLRVCVEHRVYFLLDRLYWRLVFDGDPYPAPRVDQDTIPWLIQVDGISKSFRRTGGIRIGWTVAPPDVSQLMINIQSHYTSGPALPTQYAALAAISGPYDPELRDDLERKRNLLREAGGDLPGVTVWPTPAAFYSFWDVRRCFGKVTPAGRTLRDSLDVATYLLETVGAITAPGSAFLQEGYLRLSFATPDEHITGGCHAMRSALGALQTD